MNASLSSTFILPFQATACSSSIDGIHLAVGSDDGSVRLYQPPESKVRKAIRGLGVSVSSVLFQLSKLNGNDDSEDSWLWVAAGKSLFRFDLHSLRMILTRADASAVNDVGTDEEDNVNHLAISTNSACLACTTDAGDIYVFDIASGLKVGAEVFKMKTKHESIAWTVSFIPDRPSELLTGGYDCTLLLHDFKLRTLLARIDFAPAPALAPGISSLPPFITAVVLSAQGVVAAGTADGRIWVGLGGMKLKSISKKGKRNRKWGGLSAEEGFFEKVGENLIAGLQFVAPDMLLSCTVHGRIALHRLVMPGPRTTNSSSHQNGSTSDVDGSRGGLRTMWTAQSTCAKVDVLELSGQGSPEHVSVAVTGLNADKTRGTVEIWSIPLSSSPPVE